MNTQKPKAPRTAIAEQVVELKTNYPTAIQHLRQMQGACRQQDAEGRYLQFYCNKKGCFTISPPPTRHAVWATTLEGHLYVEDGRTKASLYTLQLEKPNKAPLESVLTVVWVGVVLAVWLACFLLFPAEYRTMESILSAVILVVLLVLKTGREGRIVQNQGQDAQIMLEAAVDRLKAVDDWEK
ncbi:MAG: hypothetical protein IIX28_05110 [Clostridia bacterium]|nr:hypothetical protein [Clostridia bacterium]